MRRVGVSLLLTGPLLCGCAVDNDRLAIGNINGENTVVLASIEQQSVALVEQSEPSVKGLDRSNWGSVEIVVPNDGVAHHAHFTRSMPDFDDSTSRGRGEHPTALSALETRGNAGTQVVEWLVWPFYVVGDIVLAIPRGIDHPQQSPTEPYQRYSGMVEQAAASMDEDAPPAAE
ncbi:MAG: hypothetical protein AAFX05_10590 [Planctomycetota bacterium]